MLSKKEGLTISWLYQVVGFNNSGCLRRSELAAATQKRLEEAASKKDEEERQKAAQKHVRREYKYVLTCCYNVFLGSCVPVIPVGPSTPG